MLPPQQRPVHCGAISTLYFLSQRRKKNPALFLNVLLLQEDHYLKQQISSLMWFCSLVSASSTQKVKKNEKRKAVYRLCISRLLISFCHIHHRQVRKSIQLLGRDEIGRPLMLKLLIKIDWWKSSTCFFFLSFLFFTAWIEKVRHEAGAWLRQCGSERIKNANNCKYECYVALCIGLLLLFCILKGSPD